MTNKATSIRPFIGAKDYDLSRNFYRAMGFEEIILTNVLCVFKKEGLAFYLQNAYVKDWIDNSMIFLEVEDLDLYWTSMKALDLPAKYEGVRLSAVQEYSWGKECFLHDPSGILWHIGQFNIQ